MIYVLFGKYHSLEIVYNVLLVWGHCLIGDELVKLAKGAKFSLAIDILDLHYLSPPGDCMMSGDCGTEWEGILGMHHEQLATGTISGFPVYHECISL